MVYNWQKPKKPTYSAGRIVIHSDDGRLWDYTHYFKIIQRAVAKHNQFKPLSAGIFCPAINTGYTNDGVHQTVGLPVIDWEMINEIATKGGEILSHGQYHIYFDGASISQPLSVGATRIFYTESQTRPREGFKFYIEEGDNRDEYTVLSYVHDGVNSYIDIDTPLTNAYSASAKIYMRDESIVRNIEGVVNDLATHGIECKSHINPWYRNSSAAGVRLKEYFDSVITLQHEKTVIENPADVNLYDMRRTADMRNYSFAEIDALLDDVIAKDGVAFVQNHGGNFHVTFVNLEYLVEQAMLRGVRLVKHSEAVEYLKSKGAS